ncbi:MAG: CPBP family glutamic-type intramembrane protease [Vicinamibacterales bacterium]
MILKVVIFYVLAFVFTIILGGIQEGASISPEAVILPQWGPGLAALVMLVIFRGDDHRFSVVDRSIPLSRYVVAALVPLGGALAVYLINTLILGAIPFGDSAPTPWLLLLWMPLGAFGEELGWRGYLHKGFNIRLTGVASSFIVGIMWALWHVGLYQNGLLYMGFVLLLIVSYSVVIYALVQATAFNVILAAVFHLMINITNLFSYSIINETSFMVVNALVWAAMAFTVVLARKPLFVLARPRT